VAEDTEETRPQVSAEADGAAAIRVFLVDDHRVVHIAALEPDGNLPDVVLMDLLMPAMDGIAATGEIKSCWPAIEVVVMTSFVEEAKVRGALEAGAAGYLLKDADADQVAQAIRAALAGRMHLDPVAARLLADSVRGPRRPQDSLTPRGWW
jgi:DNA-binding NarL/FixJ family response regulator